MIAGIELESVSAEFQGIAVTAAQASGASISAAKDLAHDWQLSNGQCLILLRRNIDNDLTLEIDPSPLAYIAALNATGLHTQGALVYYGDDFTYNGNHCGYELTPSLNIERNLANVAGVVVGLLRNGEHKPYTYAFVDRQQLNVAIDYMRGECFGGVEQSENTMKGLMLNVAIRYLIKWQINSRFPFPVDFNRYYELLQLHNDIVIRCQQERQRLVALQNSSVRNFRTVKSIPSTIEMLMQSEGAPAKPLLNTFEQPKMVDIFDFDTFSW